MNKRSVVFRISFCSSFVRWLTHQRPTTPLLFISQVFWAGEAEVSRFGTSGPRLPPQPKQPPPSPSNLLSLLFLLVACVPVLQGLDERCGVWNEAPHPATHPQVPWGGWVIVVSDSFAVRWGSPLLPRRVRVTPCQEGAVPPAAAATVGGGGTGQADEGPVVDGAVGRGAH